MKDCWTGACASLYLEWIAYLKDRQTKALIVLGAHDPLSLCRLRKS
jgi:hypothetical protein